MTWNELSQAIRDNRQPCLVLDINGNPDSRCKIVASQAHHVLFSRIDKKGHPEYKEWTDNPLNAQPSCQSCNVETKVADNWTNSKIHLENLIVAGKRDALKAWLNDAPEKLKLRTEWEYYWKRVS